MHPLSWDAGNGEVSIQAKIFFPSQILSWTPLQDPSWVLQNKRASGNELNAIGYLQENSFDWIWYPSISKGSRKDGSKINCGLDTDKRTLQKRSIV